MSPKYDGNYYCPRCGKWYPVEEILWYETRFVDCEGNTVLVYRRFPICPVHHIHLRTTAHYNMSQKQRRAFKSAFKP